MAVGAMFQKLTTVMTSDHASVVSMNIFVALLSACIIIGHLLEENRWINESITALLIVRFLIHLLLSILAFYCSYQHQEDEFLEKVPFFFGRVFVLGSLYCLLVEEKALIY